MLVKSWNNHTIRWREDGFGCLTDMGKATNKQPSDWLRLNSTQDLILYYQNHRGIPRTQLVQVIRSGDQSVQGTWANQDLCIDFANWCDIAFRATVLEWVKEIMTKGYVDIRNLTSTEIILAQAQQLVNFEREQKLIKENLEQVELLQIEQSTQLEEHDEKITDIDEKLSTMESEMHRVVNPDGYYYTVMGYNHRYHRGQALSRQAASNLGRQASRLCRDSNLEIQQLNDARFGCVNSYPEEILRQVFGD